jgi:hypothetical protein
MTEPQSGKCLVHTTVKKLKNSSARVLSLVVIVARLAVRGSCRAEPAVAHMVGGRGGVKGRGDGRGAATREAVHGGVKKMNDG